MAKGKYEYWLSKEGLLLIEGWARDGLTDEQIAHNMGISRSTLNEWRKKYSDISDTLKRGKEVVDRQVENALLKRALGYDCIEVIRERISDTGQKKRHDNGIELTEQQWEIAKNYFDNNCCYCGKREKLTKDHIKPLSTGGELVMNNVLPCCQSCNSSKKDRDMLSWFQSQPFYDRERAKKIHEYINFALSMMQILNQEDNNSELVVTKEVVKHILPDVTAGIFWLKNRQPEKWRDKPNNNTGNEAEKNIAEALRGLFGGTDK